MIELDSALLEPLVDPTPESVIASLRTALRLEHATIPPYLYSYYSLNPEKNAAVADIISTVFVEEMLHMLLVANVMNALGGSPRLADPDLLPVYPGPLPEAVVGGLEVGLEPCSPAQIGTMFMGIEEPEKPKKFKSLEVEEFVTIGRFYLRIITALEALPPSAWYSPPRNQISAGMDGIVVVTDSASAKKALQTIIEQGEGTEIDPHLTGDGPAHYYRFEQILKGKRLVENPDAPPGAPPEDRWHYAGKPIRLDQSGVYPVPKNPKTASYPAGSAEQKACREFNAAYITMLGTLEEMMNGAPELLRKARSEMSELADLATAMASGKKVPGKNVGPSFEYQPSQA